MKKVVVVAYDDEYTSYGYLVADSSATELIKALRITSNDYVNYDIMSVTKAYDEEVNVAKSYMKDFETELMYEKYGIDAWIEHMFYEMDCTNIYDRYEGHFGLSAEDEENFLTHCKEIKAKEIASHIWDTMMPEDEEIQHYVLEFLNVYRFI